MLEKNGRYGGIRTHDPWHPMTVRYQAALRTDWLLSYADIVFLQWVRVWLRKISPQLHPLSATRLFSVGPKSLFVRHWSQ